MANPKTLIEEYADAGFKPELINREYAENHIKILDATRDLNIELGSTPTYQQIADRCKLTKQTVSNHYRTMRVEQDIKPEFKKYAFEVLQRHIALMRQDDDKGIALKACLTLEDRLFDIVSKLDTKKVDITDNRTTKLIVEIDDSRKKLEIQNVQPAELITDGEEPLK